MSSLRLSLLLLCVLLAFPSLAVPWSVSNLTILSISSPQCSTAASGAALDCVLPAFLTILTSPVPSSVYRSSVYYFGLNIRLLPYVDFYLPSRVTLNTSAAAAGIIEANMSTLVGDNATYSSWTAVLVLPGYVQPALGSLLNVSFYSEYDYVTASPSFLGLSVLSFPPPQLLIISGCNGSGLSTLGCDADTAALTLQGSGFQWLQAVDFYNINIGACVLRVAANTAAGLQVLNNSYATYSLSSSYDNCAYPHPNYDGRILSFAVDLAWPTPAPFGAPITYNHVSSAALTMSFALCPLPHVTQLEADQCQELPVTGNASIGEG